MIFSTKHPRLLSLLVVSASAFLVLGTSAVVKAQLQQQPQVPIQNMTATPAALRALVDSFKPVQLPLWTTPPAANATCAVGEMAMVVPPTRTAAPGAFDTKLYVCTGTMPSTVGATCVQSYQKSLPYCVDTDATCTQRGGTPSGSSQGFGIICHSTNQTRACNFLVPQCTEYQTKFTPHWVAVATTPAL
jgi:hypothetical protein